MKFSKNKCKLLCDCNNQLKFLLKTGTEIDAEHKSLPRMSSWTHLSELFHEIVQFPLESIHMFNIGRLVGSHWYKSR